MSPCPGNASKFTRNYPRSCESTRLQNSVTGEMVKVLLSSSAQLKKRKPTHKQSNKQTANHQYSTLLYLG